LLAGEILPNWQKLIRRTNAVQAMWLSRLAKEEEFGILSRTSSSSKDDLLGPLRYYDKYIILKVLDLKQPERLSYQQRKSKYSRTQTADFWSV
jgi:hypothetical protein